MTNKIPTLNTPRLSLRPFTVEDVPPFCQILQNPNVLQYFPGGKTPKQEQVHKLVMSQLKHWEDYGYGWWAVQPLAGQPFMGWCGLQYLPETDEIEVGYLLGQDFWGQGYATEAGRASLKFAFNALNLTQIVGIVHPDNLASQRVLEKLGMQYIEEKEYFGMRCFRYLIDQAGFQRASQSW